MCVKLPHGDLNSNSCHSHLTSTYIYKVTIAPRVCNGAFLVNGLLCLESCILKMFLYYSILRLSNSCFVLIFLKSSAN